MTKAVRVRSCLLHFLTRILATKQKLPIAMGRDHQHIGSMGKWPDSRGGEIMQLTLRLGVQIQKKQGNWMLMEFAHSIRRGQWGWGVARVLA